MNRHMLQGNGNGISGPKSYDPSVDLNDPKNIGKAAVLFVEGMRQNGADVWFAGHRGGMPAAERVKATGNAADPSKPSDVEYYSSYNNSLATNVQAILTDPSLLTDDRRVEQAEAVPYG